MADALPRPLLQDFDLAPPDGAPPAASGAPLQPSAHSSLENTFENMFDS